MVRNAKELVKIPIEAVDVVGAVDVVYESGEVSRQERSFFI